MKNLITLVFLTLTFLANAQPNHYREKDKNFKREKDKRKNYSKSHKHDKKKHYYKRNHRKDYNYRVERELSRYEFLRLSELQRSKLQVSINFLANNQYNEREYERRLKSDLYTILSRDQYRNWENRAYNNGNTFIFNFGK